MKPKISVIVPVYNISVLLPRCMDSILNQTLKEIEIILVDDGSTDNSGEVCDSYIGKDDRVKVIHQANGGLSAARNTGIRNSTAPYILFVDSDDYIHCESCERLYNMAVEKDCEIVGANEIKVIDRKDIPGAKYGVPEGKVLPGKEYLVYSIEHGDMSMCAPFALYKRSLIIDNGLYFKEGILHEDELWTPQTYLAASSVTCIDFYFYYHWYREGSITHSKNKAKNCEDTFQTCDELFEVYKKLDSKSRKCLNNRLCMLYMHTIYEGQIKDANRLYPLKTAYSIRNISKAILYFISPRFYLWLHNMSKKLK